MDNMVKKKLSAFRKRQTVFVVIYGLINAAVIAGIIVYYRLKEQALAGALYLHDNAYGETFVRKMFSSWITDNNIRAGRTAMESAGYGSHGFSYVSRINGEMYALIAITAVLLIALGSELYNCYRLGHKGFVKKVCGVYADNERLSKQLENEHIYNKEQHRKMQDFIENIAHQIKTPLTALSLALDRLEESGENRGLLERCFEQIERIRSFISKLMTISRMEAGKIIMTEQDINVNSMLCDVVSQLPKNDCNITVECDDEDYCINADEEWIREAFINIIQNSSELCDTVKVKAVCRDDKCIVNIKDNGSGFEEDRIPYVFDRFETTGSAAAGHAGIGLNLSRLIIEAHHGTVDVRNNEDGKGAVIRVQIPRYVLKRKAEL